MHIRKVFWKISKNMFMQSLNPTSQISYNFHTELGKIELLIILDKEMVSI